MNATPGYVDGLPDICGNENLVAAAATANCASAPGPKDGIDFGHVKSACAMALHMHQPLIPAGGDDLPTAEIISNLKYMLDNPGIGDNHNAQAFHWCYKRMAEFIPQLIREGEQPRIMLEYSGTLLHGLRRMGLHDVFDALKEITVNPTYAYAVEWLGCPWGHAVAPSTPVQDYRLHVKAWLHHFAAIFGRDALARVRGFSPSEMALPNHPDVAYEFTKTLRDLGFQWVLVQEHTVENPATGRGPDEKHIPHRLVCVNSHGQRAQILAIVKTQGSDAKLVAQGQPYYEAKGLARVTLGGISAPRLVTQIADGENGGVMMNEFPSKYFDVVRESSGSETPLMNVSEYLDGLAAAGVTEDNLPLLQPLYQKRIWDRMQPGDGPERLAQAIGDCRREDGRFHMEGGSWTNNMSWVRGYENVLGPMEKVSSLFNEKVLAPNVPAHEYRRRNALFHLLVSQTSCYRYWGQGRWTDYAREVCRRATEILVHDFA